MRGIYEDLRCSFRALIHNRGVAVTAILSLALGIGANTTIFTLMNAVLLRPLPVRDPSTLVALHTVDPRNPGLLLCSYLNYRDYRDRNQVFSSLAVYSSVGVAMTGNGEPQLLLGQLVSANYFPTLGIQPLLGRAFLPEEDGAPGAAPVVVISHGLWTRQFGADPRITSRTITLAGRAFRIIGVAPPGFRGINQLYSADVWAPVAMYQSLYPNPTWVEQRRALVFAVVGRLKPGIGMAKAEAGLQGLSQELERQFPKDNDGRRAKLTSVAQASLAARTRKDLTSASTVLMVVSGLVLLIACANIANLLLARAAGRTKEITVRLALGASRAQLIRQLLMESVLLSLLGGVTALVFARWARDLLWSMRPTLLNYANFPMEFSGTVLAYTISISVFTGILFGLAPALRSTNPDLATNLKERSGKASVAPGWWNPRSVLVSVQVAFSVVALIGAGLFIRGVQSAWQIDLGFDAGHLGVVGFNVGDRGYDEPRGREFQAKALEIAAATPGVKAATISKDPPFKVSAARTILLDGQEDLATGKGRLTLTSVVWPGYFQTIGIPLLAGRGMTPKDTPEKPRVAIVNEAAASHFWPGESAIGKRLHFFGDSRSAEVVGVARNANYQNIGEPPQALIYLSMVQYYFPMGVLYLRTYGDPGAVAASVRRNVQALDGGLLLRSEGYDKTIREALWAQRLSAALLAAFGILALLLASMGIYGVVSYSINQRAREIGVRIALGATTGQVRRMLLLQGFRMVGSGMLLGLAVAAAASKAVQGMLFRASPWDAATFTTVPLILSVVAFAACWIPALRVTRIDPANALRDE
jgi:predicted permease